MKSPSQVGAFEKFSANRLFDGIERNVLNEIRPQVSLLRVRKDDVIYREGDRGDFLYLVGEGVVKISQLDRLGHAETIGYVESGNFFGGRALLETKPHSAMATAAEPALLGTVKKKAFEKMLALAPARLHVNFLRAVTERLRSINSRFMSDRKFHSARFEESHLNCALLLRFNRRRNQQLRVARAIYFARRRGQR